MFDINTLIRKNIKDLKPYSSARNEFSGEGLVWLDANENPYETTLNRYPDPKQIELKKIISTQKNVKESQVFIGNGSDEIIDLLFRAFCNPGEDKAYIFNPTYGMYKVSAAINNIEVVEVSLDHEFQLPHLEDIKEQCLGKGLMFICSPNNPTGNTFELVKIKSIAQWFKGLVVIDEAYIDFSNRESALSVLDEIPNLIILQTLSKAYGLAGLRLGIGFAQKNIIEVLNKIKPPYNINTYSQSKGIEVLRERSYVLEQIDILKLEREKMHKALDNMDIVVKVYPSEANFLLVEFKQVQAVYQYLQNKGIIVRNRHSQINNCIRISIGKPLDNELFINTLKLF